MTTSLNVTFQHECALVRRALLEFTHDSRFRSRSVLLPVLVVSSICDLVSEGSALACRLHTEPRASAVGPAELEQARSDPRAQTHTHTHTLAHANTHTDLNNEIMFS